MRTRRAMILLLAATAWSPAALAQPASTADAPAATVLPRSVPAFEGTLGRTLETSTPARYAPLPEAPPGAPNILLILTDDVGFGAASPFGGPVPAATFDRLAKNGERYNAFHTTALCAPSRAALLTGRNPHKVGFGAITEMSTGYPGYNSILPKSAATIGEVLRQNGYATAWFGKNHNTPEWEQSALGPFDRWPDGLGFDYFYGFMGGATSQYNPALFENRTPIERPAGDPDYILDRDLADHAISWLKTVNTAQPDKPVLLYYAPGTSHSPHHAPKEWIARFKGQFDRGWDRMREESLARQIRLGVVPKGTKLSPRPAAIPAWASLSAEQQRLYAHMMEVYAAALAHADHQMGRLLDELQAQGRLENTLVIYIQGDNGGSGEGGPTGSVNDIAAINGLRADLPTMMQAMDRLGGPDFYNNYPVGWAWAMNTPFQWTKQVASHLGGVRNGMVMSWPARMTRPGGVRSQFHHLVDIAPTIYEAAGITVPTRVNGVDQLPLDGTSMLYSLNAPDAPARRTRQLFEMQGNAALYADGWWANSKPTRAPWDFAGPGGLPTEGAWELYDLTADFSQSTDLAARYPDRLKAMQERFWQEAADGQVLPIDNRSFARWETSNRPSLLGDRTRFSFAPSPRRITGGAFPDLSGRSWQASARITTAPGKADGTIVMNGSRHAGWALMLDAGRPVFAYKASDAPDDLIRITGAAALAPGDHHLAIDFVTDSAKGPGTVRLLVDGQAVASAAIPHVIPVLLPDNATIGWSFDTIDPATPATPFSGEITDVTITLIGGAG
ncbi:MAG TPA: arylsulfatase [Sphingobium sp.]|nr:arylsulfatase [Sphingobium sp.]